MSTQSETIKNFGEQWSLYPENSGYYGSLDFLKDLCSPLIDTAQLKNKHIVDIGSGTGRITRMLIETGASRVTAVEPSQAVDLLRSRSTSWGGVIDVISGDAASLPDDLEADYVFFIGVLHHIPDARGALLKARQALKPGGRLFVWVYAREGHTIYLAVLHTLRRVFRVLPDALLQKLCRGLSQLGRLYAAFCRRVAIAPLAGYMTRVYSKLSPAQQELVIFDQINPAYTHYYRREELEQLLQTAGFKNLQLYNRHGYSWSALAVRNV